MEKEKETIIANKYHFDQTYKFLNYNKNSIRLAKKDGNFRYIPTSICDVFKPDNNGKVTIMIEKWFIDKDDNRDFFN